MKLIATLEVYYSTRDMYGNVYYHAVLTNNKNGKSIPIYCECTGNTESQLRQAGLGCNEYKTVELERGQRKVLAMCKGLKYVGREDLTRSFRKFLNLRRKAA